jgi:hypothetical protein
MPGMRRSLTTSVDGGLGEEGERGLAGGGVEGLDPLLREDRAEHLADARLVVDDEDGLRDRRASGHRATCIGNFIATTVPSPTRLVSVRAPPWASITRRTNASPRPDPRGLVV